MKRQKYRKLIVLNITLRNCNIKYNFKKIILLNITLKNLNINFLQLIFHRTPSGLEDVSKYPQLFAELLRGKDWSINDLKKVAGLNLLRVFKQVREISLQTYTLNFNNPAVVANLLY